MNKVWTAMILAGIACYGISALGGAEGNGSETAQGFMDGLLGSCEEAVYFVIGLTGIMGLWSGFMNIARGSGLIHAMAEKSRRIMKFLFPGEKNEDTLMMMLMGFTANIFGAGNSATVFSLQAMKQLDDENGHGESASDEMCMFAAVNMSMLQLVPITVIQIRASAGSAAASDIIMPSIISGAAATAGSIAVCKFYEKRSMRLRRRKNYE